MVVIFCVIDEVLMCSESLSGTGGVCATAHVCAVMMNECLVCCVYGAVM